MKRLSICLALLALPLTACDGCGATPTGASASAPLSASGPAGAVSAPRLTTAGKTTNAEIAMSNLDSAIDGARVVAKTPRGSGALVGLLLQRAKILGHAEDLEEALKAGESEETTKPKDIEAVLTHARALAGVHRFEEALAAIGRAEALGPRAGQLDVQKASVLLALGRYDEASALMKPAIEVWPNTGFLHLQAVILHHMNRISEAEETFVLAESKYVDVSPIQLAMLYSDRAAMWESQGDLVKATTLYRAAHERVPSYAHAAVHYASLVTPADAVKILSPLVPGSNDRATADPDLLANLAGFRALTGDAAGAADLAAARTRFEDLQKRLPQAYADHAGWFWLGPGGEPARAFDAAKQNLEARKTAEAYELFVVAALGAGKRDEACAKQPEMKALKYGSPKLDEALRQLGDCAAK